MKTGERTALYRFFDQKDQLLYVGITRDPPGRWAQHAADKAWWPSVSVREVEWWPTRPAAEAAEKAAITAERPLHNVWGTDRHREVSMAFHGVVPAGANHPAVRNVRGALRALEQIADPTERAVAATALLREWPRLHREVGEVRIDAVRAMHSGGKDFPEIGVAIGTDRSRAWRIWKGL